MRIYLIKMFGISLGFTLAVELTAACLLRGCMKRRERKKTKLTPCGNGAGGTGKAVFGSAGHMVLLVVLVNILTNPLAVLLCWIARMRLTPVLSFPAELLVEAAVVVAEACVYRSFMEKPGWQTGRPLLLSAVTNVCSWTAGMVLGGWIDLAVTVLLRIRRAW
ncbi:MAG: hypothetical protein HFH93_05470 [Lachnospiraceae bacterium]|nr:hypothetical protein [Lachnospiraceae bacterium]